MFSLDLSLLIPLYGGNVSTGSSLTSNTLLYLYIIYLLQLEL